jgi:inositol transport system substrate-binding protein
MNHVKMSKMSEGGAEQGKKQKKIYILLTKQMDPVSRVFSIFAGSRYFHASIGFEERGTFYSFNTKRGFCIEQPSVRRQHVPCMLYSLDVTDEIYKDIESRINIFKDSSRKYGFSPMGMFFAIFRMPLRIPFFFHNNSYFCSMFVSELIIKSGAAKLKFKPHRYLPRHFSHEPALELCFEGVWGQPPEFSEDQGDMFMIPVVFAKRHARMFKKRARVTVRMTRRNAYRSARFARSKMIVAKDHVFRAPGRFYILCRDNIYTATKTTQDAIEKWWRSLL